jgi:hypothetical protein
MEPASAQVGAYPPDVDAPEATPEPAELARMFADYAKAAHGTAIKNHSKGDLFGETLAKSRADVYEKASELVRQLPLADAATEMMNRARASHVRTPPLIDFDAAGVQYNTARAWQFCAWKIDPTLPEVAPKWD